MKVGLYSNARRDSGYKTRNRLVSLFAEHSVLCETEEEYFADCEIVISLGGDGTFLTLAHLENARDKLCIGLNLGSVGFLTEFEPADIEKAVKKIVQKDFEIEERMMIKMSLFDDEGKLLLESEALNDVVVMRDAGSRIITTDVSINEMHVEQIPGDGLIVATPTGSTAYSLAAGGPIVHPSMDVFVITPICPHTLHNRSYLAPGEAKIELRLNDSDSYPVVSADGKKSHKFVQGMIRIERSPRCFRMIRLFGDRFYQRLPQKIQERGMNR